MIFFLILILSDLSDWMNLRRNFELWTSNIVATVIDYGTFEVGLNVFCIMLWLGMAPQNHMFEQANGASEWNVVI